MSQYVTLSVFTFHTLSSKIWAFLMMQFAHKHLKDVSGQIFYKLFGSGKSNFNPFPDWSTYALLQTWNSEKEATDFFENSKIYNTYIKKTVAVKQYHLSPIQSRGSWNNINPFKVERSETVRPDNDHKIAVITRASIKPKLLFKFWKAVPRSQKPLQEAKDLIYTKGFGEVPFFEMATFSVWKSISGLNEFAYRSKEHTEVIKKTRDVKWYSEEMFARFKVLKIDELKTP